MHKRAQDHVIHTYRDRAKRYDASAKLYYLLGYPQQVHRRKAMEQLQLQPGDTVVEIGCGTGLNFAWIQRAISPEGRIVGVDLTDAMLAQAQRKVERQGWKNVTLIQSDAEQFEFPSPVDAVLSTYALNLVPNCGDVVVRGSQALSRGGRFVVLDTQIPDDAPAWLARLAMATLRPFAVTEEWRARRPWESIRTVMNANLTQFSWTDYFFGLVFLAVGSRGSGANTTGPSVGEGGVPRQGTSG